MDTATNHTQKASTKAKEQTIKSRKIDKKKSCESNKSGK